MKETTLWLSNAKVSEPVAGKRGDATTAAGDDDDGDDEDDDEDEDDNSDSVMMSPDGVVGYVNSRTRIVHARAQVRFHADCWTRDLYRM